MSATWEIREGDALERLREMPDESVQCCVTSPPYFGLRDYGTGEWDGGEDGCDHLRPAAHGYEPFATSTLGPKRDGVSPDNSAHAAETKRQQYRDECGKCGARRVDRQIGLEASPDEFVARLVGVFREVRRVLRLDGTLWLNIGDSYASGGRDRYDGGDLINGSARGHRSRPDTPPRCKPKDLLGIPWLLAFALRADGWYLRSDIIWAKPNPMPESVTDRPTSAHEHVFLLSRSPRYFYDADAIREPDSGQDHPRSVLNGQPSLEPSNGLTASHRGIRTVDGRDGLGRNKRNVWEIATQPYPDAHFATFPPRLVEPCILAGARPGDAILDPFAGAGTTGLVALRHNRSFIGVELNPAYAEMARERIRRDAPLLNTPAEAILVPAGNPAEARKADRSMAENPARQADAESSLSLSEANC